ncbi:hypothetical protein [Herbaspirillum frisingense]|uniref:hypothetical protein n=1 Tax=Herbaspirillum frisingense TaxID=92645 RepID=UPI001F2CB2DE|nr:hypothetical protein [Herbaspirillum frisingense]UIN22249.1 hypothetical protein LAZ82_03810 [Herbaspirillum frisingense]
MHIVERNKACADIGFISNPPRDKGALNVFASWLSGINRDAFSFFDHGITHTLDEFRSESQEYYDAVFLHTQKSHQKIFGCTLDGFGAPFNSMGGYFLRYFAQHRQGQFIYYPDIVPAAELSGLAYVSHRYHLSFELREQGFNPSFEFFRKKYSRPVKERSPMVLQVHPNRWSDEGFDQFAEILTYLRRLGGNFMSVKDFVACTQPENDKLQARGADKVSGQSWFSSRYSADALTKTDELLEKICHATGQSWQALRTVADFGAGAGDWIYLLSGKSPDSRFFAIEPDSDLASVAEEKLRSSNRTNVRVLNTGFDTAVVSNVDLTLCNRALNYFDLPTYLDKLNQVSAPHGFHYVGYQDITFYLKGMLRALELENYDLARRRINVVISSMEYWAGLEERKTAEVCVSVHSLISLFNAAGHEFTAAPLAEEEAVSAVNGVSGLLFRRNETAERQAQSIALDHLGLAKAARNRGWPAVPSPTVIEKVAALSPHIEWIRKGDYSRTVTLFDRARPSEEQRPELILSIVSAFGLRKFALCRELLSLCNFKDF